MRLVRRLPLDSGKSLSLSLDFNTELKNHPPTKFFEADDEKRYSNAEYDLDVDPQAKYVVSGTLECTRNLEDFELPKSLNVNQLEETERIITSVFLTEEMTRALYPNASDEDVREKGSGSYYTMNEVLEDPSEVRVVLAANGLLIPLWNIPESDRLHGKQWPYG